MRARLLVLGVSLVVALVVALAAWNHLRSKGPASPATVERRPTGSVPAVVLSPRQLTAEIIEHGVTPERAKQLFSMVVGPLSGVGTAAKTRDPSEYDGTLAVGYIYQVWDSLTVEQREAAMRLIHPAGNTRVARVSTASLLPQLIPAGFLKVTTHPKSYYDTLAQNAAGTLAAFLHVPPVLYNVN
ncbi:MAG TPA: hypothetical protein VK395_18675, partial [Gemmataceae bacterium]|nr:hypothetical protein [Gemmataceae bacterium]